MNVELKKNLIIIPARGGSKGIPLKNIQPVGGKPLIYWAIKAAIDSEMVDRLIVSTDHNEIATIARESGAEVIIRPEDISSDFAKTEDVMSHVLSELEKDGYVPDFVSLIQCTSPFLTSDIIKKCVSTVTDDNTQFDSCITVFKPDGYEFKWKTSENKNFIPDHDVENRPRRQDLDLPYHENGAFYITKTDLYVKSKNRFGGNLARVTAIEMNEIDSLQIDSPEHLLMADMIMHHRINGAHKSN